MFAQKSGWCVASPSGTVASSISKLAGLNYNMNHPGDHQGDADDVITMAIWFWIWAVKQNCRKQIQSWSKTENWELF